MAVHNDLGHEGEEAACRYLMRQGYTLLERNWRTAHLEVDIIAEWYGEVVFVEVKTRRDERFAPAREAVTEAKKGHIAQAARDYMLRLGERRPFRFDIITVVGASAPFAITHYRCAYSSSAR